jgi:hypothetical protein
MSQTTFLSDVLGDEPIPAGKLAYFQARLSNVLHEVVLKRFMELESKTGLTRAELARRLGRKPEQVTRWLGSPGNWTLETVSDLLIGMGCELKVSTTDLNTYEDPQALAYASEWPGHRTVQYGIINALNRPVTATFRPGQTVHLMSIEADRNLYQVADAQSGLELYEGIGFCSQADVAMMPLPPLVPYLAHEPAEQNPLSTDTQVQTGVRSKLT